MFTLQDTLTQFSLSACMTERQRISQCHLSCSPHRAIRNKDVRYRKSEIKYQKQIVTE